MPRSKTLTGIVLAVAAACFWGTMAVSGQYMITACGFNAEELTTVRIGRRRHSDARSRNADGKEFFRISPRFIRLPRCVFLRTLSVCHPIHILFGNSCL